MIQREYDDLPGFWQTLDNVTFLGRAKYNLKKLKQENEGNYRITEIKIKLDKKVVYADS